MMASLNILNLEILKWHIVMLIYEHTVEPSYIEVFGKFKFISNKQVFNETDIQQVDYKVYHEQMHTCIYSNTQKLKSITSNLFLIIFN